MSGVVHIDVEGDDDGQRLDRWLKRKFPSLPYAMAQKLIRKGQIRVEGKRAKSDTRLKAGQSVRIPPFDFKQKKAPAPVSKEDAKFIRSLVIYDEDGIIALNKPEGLAVQGGTKTRIHIDGMLGAIADKGGNKPRLVHRLDKGTSGVLLLARSAEMAKSLGALFKSRDIEKTYWAITKSAPEQNEGTINAPLSKATGAKKEMMVVDDDGKPAVTDFIVIDRAGKEAAFIAFLLHTGRTHQIRVHAAQILGCPIIGDRKYGGEEAMIEGMDFSDRLHLHARMVKLVHPKTGKNIEITAPLPENLQKSWKAFGFDTDINDEPFAS
jgi:23S rRNA pseudouridine955/2504/2580 synthase